MKINKDKILKEINSLSLEELKAFSFAFLKILDHVNSASKNETRKREKARLIIAKKFISKCQDDYYK